MKGKGRNIARVAVVLFVAALLTATAGMALAHEGGWGRHHGNGHRHHCLMKFERKLGLTETQKAQAKEIFQANREVVKPIVTNLRAERKNLRALINADKIDEAAIRAETARVAAIQAELNVNRAKVGAQFRAILTPEQLGKLKELRREHRMGNDMPETPPTE